ncbi:hypothetical protein GCM10029992_37510 [Glycomyces albus]
MFIDPIYIVGLCALIAGASGGLAVGEFIGRRAQARAQRPLVTEQIAADLDQIRRLIAAIDNELYRQREAADELGTDRDVRHLESLLAEAGTKSTDLEPLIDTLDWLGVAEDLHGPCLTGHEPTRLRGAENGPASAR